MLENKDRISRPACGRFFPVTGSEAVRLIQDLGFVVPIDLKRLNITFRNPGTASAHGSHVAAFYPADEIIIYSLPEDFDRLRAKVILKVALREFTELGKGAKPTDRRRKAVSFRAYFTPLAKLTVTKRTQRATLVKYRGGAKFSHAFKPKGVKKDEQVVHSLDSPNLRLEFWVE